METAILPVVDAAPVFQLPEVTVERLLELFKQGRNENTMRSYSRSIQDFAGFVGVNSAAEAAKALFAAGHGPANAVVLGYRAKLVERGLSPASVNNRIAAVRSLVQLGKMLGVVGWNIEIPGVRQQNYRDTRGPGYENFRAMLAKAKEVGGKRGARDVVILRLLFECGLRRAEAVNLDLADLDLKQDTAWIMGKGRTEKESITLPAHLANAIRDWLELRSSEPGPLLVNLDRAHNGERLSGKSVWEIVRGYGAQIGVKAKPHGLRHSSISRLLEKTSGNIREVQKFSRHKSVQTVLIYDDNRQDVAGRLANMLSEE